MRKFDWISGAVIAVVGFAAVAVPGAEGQRRPLAMLDGLADGRWELRIRDDKNHIERLCLRNGRSLIQLRHPDLGCETLVVEDSSDSVIVQYTCRGRGYGRTHIRKETSSLVQVETQGVAHGLPFAFSAEARRTGDCRS